MTKPKKGKKPSRKLKSQSLRAAILRLFKKNPKKGLTTKQIAKKTNVSNPLSDLDKELSKLVKEGEVYKLPDGKYRLDKFSNKGKKSREDRGNQLKRQGKIVTGTIDMTRSGSAYLESEETIDDVFISAKNLGSALHQDTVEAEVFVRKGRRKPDGKVIKVVKRAYKKFIGQLFLRGKLGMVHVNHPKMSLDIKIPADQLMDSQHGDRVVVEIERFTKNQNKEIWGRISANLGAESDNDLEMNTILINNGFDIQFGSNVLKELETMSDKITSEELSKRRDMRDVLTFTIDPLDAKDFDDAISFQKLDNGLLEVGVHIADVTHFVRPGTELDKEALERSTSVYLVDRVCPMLPEKLSNGLCSLRPHEDKFTFSAVFQFDEKYKIKNQWFGKTLTHSDQRFTYEEAQEIIEGKKHKLSKAILTVDKIAKRLRKKKFKDGAINFESDEVRFKLDENGTPIGVYVKERKDAHLLVEDFMLLANRAVATFMAKKVKAPEIPFVYRVHDVPDPERLQDFSLFASELGVKLNVDTPQNISKSFNHLAAEAKNDPSLKLLQPLAIRTMAKAIYTTDNIGHYGLAFDFYTHFTSPIRRYADVLVHRILYENLEQIKRFDKEKLEVKCKHISSQERKAMDAERESIKYKQVEYMSNNIGEIFEGQISGFVDRGMFVELVDSKSEGMVDFNKLGERFDIKGRFIAEGRRSGREFKMGDLVQVRIVCADLDKRQLDFDLIELE